MELCAVGDVSVNRDDPASAFELARPILAGAEVTFGNCESVYSDRGDRNPHTSGVVYASPKAVPAIADAGFDVMNFANNHALDRGTDAFVETLDLLHDNGIATCGAGLDLDQASAAAVVERDGTTFAFVGCSAILFPDYDATDRRPGCAPLHATTIYEQAEMEQPGSPPRIATSADPADVARIVAEIARVRDAADVVVFTAHWGLHFTPAAVADYETEVARAAIDAGADLVLGHHQHILKPVQVYRGKVIFHGMGNFIFDLVFGEMDFRPDFEAELAAYTRRYAGFNPKEQDGYPTYPFHPDSRRTMIVRARIEDRRVADVAFTPCFINPDGQPEPLAPGDERFADVAAYLERITAASGFDTRFVPDGDRVRVAT